MTVNFAGPDPPKNFHKGLEPECFLEAVRDLGAFARQHDLDNADALLTELLAVLYAIKS